MIWRRGLLALGALFLIAAIWLGISATGYPRALKPAPILSAVLIDNVRLVSMAPGAPQAQGAMAVLVVNGVIDQIGPAGSLASPQDGIVIDGAGKTLTPGLIDAHVHVWDEAELAGYLAHGVTGVRNMSGMPFHLPLEKRIAEGRILGPDFITTGPILNSPGRNQQDNHQIVVTAEQARAAVAKQYDQGYREIKIYSNLRREPYDAVTEEAAARGMRVSGHTPEGVRGEGVPYDEPFDISFEESLGRGFTTIEHVESIVWHGLRDELDEAAMLALAEKIAASGEAVTPTLIAHANLIRVAESQGDYLRRPGAETVNPLYRMLDKGTFDFWSGMDPAPRETPRAAFYLQATKMLHDAGVTLVAGTDAGIFTNIPGSAMTRELELLVEAGLTPYAALQTATVNAGEVLGFDKTGVIAPGWRANLILVDGDPLRDVSTVENPVAVMIGGRWLDEKKLEELKKGAAQTSIPRTARRAIAMLRDL
ncbi:amidohydrolase family protein [Hyphococcus sp.]|jgi:imidazolonepropionase-like amidohydrolase|uniref:amidohydrolase family protein n=1 Tax=Hyphococcus sp. TaxID=2038636 RepID=UPI003D148625